MDKLVERDKFGRKTKTSYFDNAGNLEHTNEYFYVSDRARTPTSGEQTYFRTDGTKESKTSFVYDEQKRAFRTVQETIYDTKSKALKTKEFDKMGNVIKEKYFSHKKGFTFVHRRELQDGQVVKRGNFVILAGQLVEKKPQVDKIISEYNRYFVSQQKTGQQPAQLKSLSRLETRDEFDRKTKSSYFDEAGHLIYSNEYFYASDKSNKPIAGDQTYFSINGTRETKKSFVYDEKINTFRTQREVIYDRDDKAIISSEFDKNGEIIKQKFFSYEKGFTFVHRREFKDEESIKDSDFVVLAGQLIERTPDVDNLISTYNRRLRKPQKEKQKVPFAMAYLAKLSAR